MDLDLQKAGIWKRFSAWMCDTLAIVLVALVLGLLLSTWTGYDENYDILEKSYEKYGEKYGISYDIEKEEYDKLPEATKKLYDEANKEMNSDPQMLHAYAMTRALPPMIISISVLVASLLLEFAVPMIFKNGQTLGKKLFGIAVMRTNGVRVSGPVTFIRGILGKCTIETLVPVFIIFMFFNGQLGSVALIVLLLLLVLQISVMIITKTNSAIHDLLADTVTVDFSSQRIFGSEEELIAYKTKVHAERVARDNY